MKKLILPLLLFCIAISSAQNLIPNGDFEAGPNRLSAGWQYGIDSTCAAVDTVLGPDFWTVTGGTPDRLTEDDPLSGWCVDRERHTAQSGKAYITLASMEAGKTTLVNPLQKDSIYNLSCYAGFESFGGGFLPPMRFAIRFNNNMDSLTSPFFNSKQWQYCDTTFIALANATEIEIIGLFDSIASGIKIDNIKLEKVTPNSLNDYKFSKTISIYPNPAKDQISIKSLEKNSSVQILNMLGQVVIERHIHPSEENIKVLDLPSGIYYILISEKNKIYKQKFFITD